MNKYFIILLSILSFQLNAQINNGNYSEWSFKDSLSGGEANIILDKKLENIVKAKEQSICLNEALKPPRELTPDEKCAKQQKIMGYKIQIFYTKDRSAAEKVRDDFSKKFPNLTPELIYASPDYRVLVGDYFTRASASDDLRRIKRTYPAAFAVQWRIWCRKAI